MLTLVVGGLLLLYSDCFKSSEPTSNGVAVVATIRRLCDWCTD